MAESSLPFDLSLFFSLLLFVAVPSSPEVVFVEVDVSVLSLVADELDFFAGLASVVPLPDLVEAGLASFLELLLAVAAGEAVGLAVAAGAVPIGVGEAFTVAVGEALALADGEAVAVGIGVIDAVGAAAGLVDVATDDCVVTPLRVLMPTPACTPK